MGPRPPKSPKLEFQALMDAELQKALGATQVNRGIVEAAKVRLRALEGTLMPLQKEFVTDLALRKAAITTRQAGKTFAVRHLAAKAVLENEWSDRQKNQPIFQYITQTAKDAVDLFWTPFRELCDRLGLEAHWDDHQLRAQFPNGVLVRAGGCATRAEIEKYRGVSYVGVVIDEAQSLGPALLEDLYVQSITPALLAYNGWVALTGTPGFTRTGLFFDIYSERRRGWAKHTWSYMTNVSFAPEVRTLDWLEENVGPVSSPKVQREYFANWVSDSSELVYQFSRDRNFFNGDLPAGHDWRYLIGLDVGFRDPCAFVVGAYCRTHPDLFIVHAEQHQHMLPTPIANKVTELTEKYPTHRIMVDTGGSMARNNMEEWILRYNFPMQPADKTKKYDYIEHMNNQFAQGHIKVAPHLVELTKEWEMLPWGIPDPDKVRNDGRPTEHPGFNNHLSDAALYMWRESLAYRFKGNKAPAPVGTLEAFQEKARIAKIEAMKRAGKPKPFQYNRLFK